MEHTFVVFSEPGKNYIILKFKGDLTEDKEAVFKKDLEDASKLLTDSYALSQKKLHILLDMTDFTGNYSAKNLDALVRFAQSNASFVEKTASFGGTDKVTIAGEVAIALSDRHNIKIFPSKDAAIGWLNES